MQIIATLVAHLNALKAHNFSLYDQLAGLRQRFEGGASADGAAKTAAANKENADTIQKLHDAVDETVAEAALILSKPNLLESVSDEDFQAEINRREKLRVITLMGVHELPPAIVERYADIIGKKTGVPVKEGPVGYRMISNRADYGTTFGYGFLVSIGDRHARAAVAFHYNLPQEAKDKALRALGSYMLSPDERLIVDTETSLTGNELLLLCDSDGNVSIAPMEEPTPPESAKPPVVETVPIASEIQHTLDNFAGVDFAGSKFSASSESSESSSSETGPFRDSAFDESAPSSSSSSSATPKA